MILSQTDLQPFFRETIGIFGHWLPLVPENPEYHLAYWIKCGLMGRGVCDTLGQRGLKISLCIPKIPKGRGEKYIFNNWQDLHLRSINELAPQSTKNMWYCWRNHT